MPAVEIRDLHKRFGKVKAVKGLSFEVEAGRVTGFLGPNGAGQEHHPARAARARAPDRAARPRSAAAATRSSTGRARQVGAVLEDAAFHPGRTARNHLRVLAVAGEHPPARVDEVLAAVGLTDAANRRVKGYSMGMRQRLAIAAALLGDPEVLILDEPTNGLDPPGISWMRGLVRHQADSGRAVLVSSHLLAEVAQSVDDVVVIAKGELRGHGTLEQVLGGDEGPATEVRRPGPRSARGRARAPGPRGGARRENLLVPGVTPEQVGPIAAEERVALRC